MGPEPFGRPPSDPDLPTIPNILVDTGSVGLRLLGALRWTAWSCPWSPTVTINTLQECVQFADFSYVWGPVARATIQMAGETAAQVPLRGETANTGIPIQIITSPFI